MGKMNKDGYSLIEMVISVAVSVVVMMGLVTIMSYVSRSMSVTEAKVSLQDEAKDAMNHLSSYAAEASSFQFNVIDGKQVLALTKKTVETKTAVPVSGTGATVDTKTETCFYWRDGGKLYFASYGEPGVAMVSLPSDQEHILAEDVVDFQCSSKVDETDESRILKKKVLHVELKMKSTNAEVSSSDDVYLRNQ